MNKIRILLVDDHALFREGLSMIISSQADMIVVGEASDGLEGTIKAAQLKPDLILMDIQMPGMDGIKATHQIKQELPDTTIVMLTVRDDEKKLFEALKQGAQGYLIKKMHANELITMARRAVAGEAVISPHLAGQMLEEFRRLSKFEPSKESDLFQLSPREIEVLNLAAAGMIDKEIAQRLCLSLNTIKTHMRNILSKLQVSSRKEAARLAKEKGLF